MVQKKQTTIIHENNEMPNLRTQRSNSICSTTSNSTRTTRSNSNISLNSMTATRSSSVDTMSSKRITRGSSIGSSTSSLFETTKVQPKTPVSCRKLNDQQLQIELNDSGSDVEVESPKTSNSSIGKNNYYYQIDGEKTERLIIKIKSKKLDGKITYVIDDMLGTQKETEKSQIAKVGHRATRKREEVYYNENHLSNASFRPSENVKLRNSICKSVTRSKSLKDPNTETPRKKTCNSKQLLESKTPTSRKRSQSSVNAEDYNSAEETNQRSTRSKTIGNFGDYRMTDTPKLCKYGTPKSHKKSVMQTPSKSAKTTPQVNGTPSRSKHSQSCKLKLRYDNDNQDDLVSPMKNMSVTPNKRPHRILQEHNQNAKETKFLGSNKRAAAKGVRSYSENDPSDEDCEESDDEYKPEEEKSSSDESSSNSSENEFTKKLRMNNFKTSKTPKTPSKLQKNTPSQFETPTKGMSKQLSKLSLNSLTPSVQQRIHSIAKPSTPLQEARMKLHVSVLPKSLPCREEEFNNIYTFLHARLSDGTGGCIYISGVPGTGKTATVNEVIRCLKKTMIMGKLDDFEFVEINGMRLSEPRQAYVQIWKQLTGTSATWEEAQKLLQDRFTKSKLKRRMTLLLVDELDLLCTKRQDVVYNLLDWPSKNGAKLVVVTIANTMDLPERILMGKVTSRLGLTRLTFPPYNFKQLEEIVISRLKDYNAFSGETVQLVARKVASVSGDARRALDICRRSTEIAEATNRNKVTMADVKKALDEMIASPKIQAIKHCSDYEKVFLLAVCAEVHRTGVEEVGFKNVYFQMQELCAFNGDKTPNITEVLAMCARLGSWRLLLCDHSRQDIHQRIVLNVSTDDIQFATQEISE